MSFEPEKHLRQIKGNDYLDVKWRVLWFREQFPHGTILTEEVMVDLEAGYARFRASVADGAGGQATATGTEWRKNMPSGMGDDFVEKAETRALGRALATLGFGTAFVGEDLSEGEHVADAPGGKREKRQSPHPEPATVADTPTGKAMTTAQLEDGIRAELRRLSGDSQDICRHIFGSSITSWAILKQLPDGSKRTGLKKLQAMPTPEHPPAVPTESSTSGKTPEPATADPTPIEEDVPHFPPPEKGPGDHGSAGPTPGEAARFDTPAERPWVMEMGPHKGYVSSGDQRVLQLWAETEGQLDVWLDMTQPIPATDGILQMTAKQYKLIRQAVLWAMDNEVDRENRDAGAEVGL